MYGEVEVENMWGLPNYLLPKDMNAFDAKLREFENLKRLVDKGRSQNY